MNYFQREQTLCFLKVAPMRRESSISMVFELEFSTNQIVVLPRDLKMQSFEQYALRSLVINPCHVG